jgi:hypothetical protein
LLWWSRLVLFISGIGVGFFFITDWIFLKLSLEGKKTLLSLFLSCSNIKGLLNLSQADVFGISLDGLIYLGSLSESTEEEGHNSNILLHVN